MGIVSYVDADGNRRWADENSKAYDQHLRAEPAGELRESASDTGAAVQGDAAVAVVESRRSGAKPKTVEMPPAD